MPGLLKMTDAEKIVQLEDLVSDCMKLGIEFKFIQKWSKNRLRSNFKGFRLNHFFSLRRTKGHSLNTLSRTELSFKANPEISFNTFPFSRTTLSRFATKPN